MNEDVKKRLYSLLWRAGMMGVAAVLAVIAQAVGMVHLDSGIWSVIVPSLGLLLGEVSKYLNNSYKA